MREFWKLNLKNLDTDEWEALCDGCAKCCYIYDRDAAERTAKPCRLLKGNRCTNYPFRHSALKLEDGYLCNPVTQPLIREGIFPDTCAYVRVYRGEELEQWQIDKARENYASRNDAS